MTSQDASSDSEQQGIIVNGEQVPDTPSGISLLDLLNRRGLDPKEASGLAVAVNEEVVHRSAWKGTMLGEGDRVEIVGATQGG